MILIDYKGTGGQAVSKNNLIIPLLLAPIIEELTFRLLLTYKKENLLISLSLIFFFFLNSSLFQISFFCELIISLIFFVLFLFLYKKIEKLLYGFWNKNFLFIFFFISFLYSFFHIKDIGNTIESHTYLVPLMMMPYFVSGILLGIIRLKYNIVAAISFHFFINFTFALSKLFFH